MKQFQESAELFKKQFILAGLGPEQQLADLSTEVKPDSTQKIWQFKSESGVTVNVTRDSLDINSTHHKTYQNEGSEKFRDQIQSVVDSFKETIEIPIITRIGLRYIDECPIVEKNNERFSEWYNTTFPINRFKIDTAIEMDTKSVVEIEDCFLRFIESLRVDNNNHKLILDFDAYKKMIDPNDYLTATDKLHSIIIKEFEKSIQEPVYEYMRGQPE